MHLHGLINERMVHVARFCAWTMSFTIMMMMTMTTTSTTSKAESASEDDDGGIGGGGGGYRLASAAATMAMAPLSCETARIKCAYRSGCGMALQNYMVGCSDVMSGRIRRCPDLCKKALIALTSTEEGQELMHCDCGGQEFCEASKRRVEVCRPDVMRANAENSVVTCSVAQWICAADPLCSTALEYYRRLCRSMFHGKKCTLRCNNSISILNRQEKAAKLRTCECDGTEDYDCDSIKLNMNRLCVHQVAASSSSAAAASARHDDDDVGGEQSSNAVAHDDGTGDEHHHVCHSAGRRSSQSEHFVAVVVVALLPLVALTTAFS